MCLCRSALTGHLTLFIAGANVLPAELFIEIIKESLPDRRPIHVLPREVALSHVCSQWRSIILNEPLLWTKIEIYSSKSFGRVQTYFERSNPAPVDIFFDVWKTDRLGRDSIEQLVDFVVERIERWERLRFFASRVSTTDAFLSKLTDLSAPNLREFRVLDDGPTLTDSHQQPIAHILKGGHPELQTIQLDKLTAMSLLSNITTLHLREHNGTLYSLDLAIITALNETCPLLRTFSIHGNFDHNSVTWNMDPTPSLTMHSVQYLWLLTGDSLPGKFLTAVAFPRLQSLWIYCPYQTLVTTLNRHPYRVNYPLLQYLTVQNSDFHLASQLAAIFPTVQNLHFPACNSWNIATLVAALSQSWERVESLVLRTRGDTHPKKFAAYLGDLISTRQMGTGSPFKRVLLDRDALRCFSRAGVSFPVEVMDVFEELTEDNYDDPWWIIMQTDKGIFR